MVNEAREIAVTVMDRLASKLGDPDVRFKVVELAARLLSMRPIAPPSKLPEEIVELPSDKRARALDAYVAELVKKGIEAQAWQMLSDIAYTIYGNAHFQSDEVRSELRTLYSRLVKYTECKISSE